MAHHSPERTPPTPRGLGTGVLGRHRRIARVLFWCVVAGFAARACVNACWAGLAGGGGSNHTAPDTVRAGEPATLQLDLFVTGNGARVAGQYTQIALYYRLLPRAPGAPADLTFRRAPEPRRVSVDERHETYTFTIPPYPAGTRGTIDYYFTALIKGGTPDPIPGMKPIRVEPP